jgi:phosphatidylglycerophosphate synthase
MDAPAEGQHKREYPFLLAGFEAWFLPRTARALPAWVTPDHLSILGLIAATGAAVSYALSNRDAAWLWGASGFLIVQWLGDSLDGTLARVRKIERPRYGYYLDHLLDAYSTLAIGLGLGLSPYMLLSVGLGISIAYLILSINVYLETHVYREFELGYGILGPTEARVLLLTLNTVAVLIGPLPFVAFGEGLTVFDAVGVAGLTIMVGLLSARVVKNLRRLGMMEPPGGRPPADG